MTLAPKCAEPGVSQRPRKHNVASPVMAVRCCSPQEPSGFCRCCSQNKAVVTACSHLGLPPLERSRFTRSFGSQRPAMIFGRSPAPMPPPPMPVPVPPPMPWPKPETPKLAMSRESLAVLACGSFLISGSAMSAGRATAMRGCRRGRELLFCRSRARALNCSFCGSSRGRTGGGGAANVTFGFIRAFAVTTVAAIPRNPR